MAELQVQVDYAKIGDAEIAAYGLAAAKATFDRDVADGLTNGDSLIITLGVVDDRQWRSLVRDGFGPDSAQFAGNIDADTGKLATALRRHLDSITAYATFGDGIPEGPQRFTGGVYYVGRAKTVERGWMFRIFAGAADGVQGHFSQEAVSAGLQRMVAIWAMSMQALYGKAA